MVYVCEPPETTDVLPRGEMVPFTPAEVVPLGETPSLLAPTVGGATTDKDFIGITLGSGGAVSGTPTGVANDVIKWLAGKSFASFL